MKKHGAGLLAMVVGTLASITALAPAMAQPPRNQEAFERKRVQLKQPLDPLAPLSTRIFLRENTRQWTLEAELRVPEPRSGLPPELLSPIQFERGLSQDTTLWGQQPAKGYRVKMERELTFQSAELYFPIPRVTSGSAFIPKGFTTQVWLGNRELPEIGPQNATFVEGLAAGARYLRVPIPAADRERLRVLMKVPMWSWDLIMDEGQALTMVWPKGWSPDAESALKPMYLIDWLEDPKDADTTGKPVQELIARALGGKDPKTFHPITAAKLIAAEVMASINPVNQFEYTGEARYIQGFRFMTVDQMLKERRAPEGLLPFLLVSAYRQAGIPARPVIGLDIEDKQRDPDPRLSSSSSRAELHVWAEFVLSDGKEEVWVPVDILRQRKAGSRAPRVDEPWRFLGNHEDLDYLLPVGFHLLPPTSVATRGAPSLWGWRVAPSLPHALSGLRLTAYSASSRDRVNPTSTRP